MQFGYFDDSAREYVITRPDTPQSWSNYLGSTEYGAIITNNAGGYSFFRSGARGRLLRLRFNSVPRDQPGRYFYLRDRETGDYWSTSWQPVGKPLDSYESTCHHGLGYTTISSAYSGIETRATYFVPLDQHFEYWLLKLDNPGDRPRQLSVFTYCEFTNQWDTNQDSINLQYSLFIVKGELTEDRLLRIAIQDNLPASGETPHLHDLAQHSWVGLVGSHLSGFDTSRDAFLGLYGDYRNPAVLQRGECTNSLAYGDNACGTLQTDLVLQPGESRELLVLLGIGEARAVGRQALHEYGSVTRCHLELEKLKRHWHSRLESLQVQTPDEDLNHTLNVWGLYNCLVTFAWSRAASLVYNGERDGLGFRDSVQDVLGILAAEPQLARSRLELLLTGQLSHGGAMPVIRPFEHRPGKELPTPPEELRSDDCLWFFNAVPAYVCETGDWDFYTRVLPYADRGQAPVLAHLRRALEFNLERTGAHGLPCGLSADWNDCLRLGYQGESLFIAFQLRFGLTAYAGICERLGHADEVSWALAQRNRLDTSIQACAWDGGWFIWAIGEDGTTYGTSRSPEGSLYLNTQLWSVISGAGSLQQRQSAMRAVQEKLATPHGLMLCAPPFIDTPVDVMRAVVYNPGIKENAGIFNHTNGWAVMAECLLGHGDTARDYLRAGMPAAWNTRAEVRQSEPYVQAQTTYSTYSPRPGETRTSWLTGAAAWSYFSAVHYVLGLRPEPEGLRIDPCIPSSWPGFSLTRKFRDGIFHITVHNPDHVCGGVARLTVNGVEQAGSLIPLDAASGECQVEVWLG